MNVLRVLHSTANSPASQLLLSLDAVRLVRIGQFDAESTGDERIQIRLQTDSGSTETMMLRTGDRAMKCPKRSMDRRNRIHSRLRIRTCTWNVLRSCTCMLTNCGQNQCT